MPSFDIVSEVDLHQLTNAVDQAGRIVANRFDFKGVQASFEREERTVVMTAEADFQLAQMEDMLRSALIKCSTEWFCTLTRTLSGIYGRTVTVVTGI